MTTKVSNEDLFRQAKAGCEVSKDQLFKANEGFVHHLANKYHSSGISVDDLTSLARVGMVKAYNTFDVDKGFKFITYASRVMANEILMEIRRNKKTRGDISLNAPIDAKDENLTLEDTLVSSSSNDIDAMITSEGLKQVVDEMYSRISDPRKQKIFNLYFYRGWNQARIAEEVGITQSYVSRLITKLSTELQDIAKTLEFREGKVMAKFNKKIDDNEFLYVIRNSGLTNQQVADFFNVSYTSIINYKARLKNSLLTLPEEGQRDLDKRLKEFKDVNGITNTKAQPKIESDLSKPPIKGVAKETTKKSKAETKEVKQNSEQILSNTSTPPETSGIVALVDDSDTGWSLLARHKTKRFKTSMKKASATAVRDILEVVKLVADNENAEYDISIKISKRG